MEARPSDRGQAFPVYIVAVAGLLFAALAFFVVGMAGATRSDAQKAADASALAAAREARDGVFGDLKLPDLKPADWEKILNGQAFDARDACAEAERFAEMNDATANCVASLPKVSVSVTTDGTVGKSVIPGTDAVHGKARATAVIKPLCSLESAPVTAPSPAPTDGSVEEPESISIKCSGESPFKLDPQNPGQLSKLARRLFSVRLVT
ncbi:pilus assembly protein TadG-related protein [Streptomyces sp. NBC_00503]|uniref:pilus assembly protein TadG-related protein n=1 Tax=Streptomyces sp. NBC_00503 TaxID=2903659 RepID=UPI002E821EBF|nr:pilus assembly protein TadG-related protein [Streptomyces sp. NBC_00503]WUD83325.1 pilus assembly protein TadG-related protein [Streptomyces sp. NBC_00503]